MLSLPYSVELQELFIYLCCSVGIMCVYKTKKPRALFLMVCDIFWFTSSLASLALSLGAKKSAFNFLSN